ncbi:MAG: dUTP diphosphatase [Planctomycetes bacterium]|nr:dUTP diphosphatase [Planctomycetota bacterium]
MKREPERSQDRLGVSIRRLPGHEDLPLPSYATSGSSGVDLVAANREPLVVQRGEVVVVPTGLALAIPEGYEGQVRARSGLALRHGLCLVNAPGTIDADYRGEIGVIVTTLKEQPFVVERGLRIAQLVFCPVARMEWSVVQELPKTRRGAGGFGHTGTG